MACGWAWGTAPDPEAAAPPAPPAPSALWPPAEPQAATTTATAAAASTRINGRLIERDWSIPTPILAGSTAHCASASTALNKVRGWRLRVRHRPRKPAALARCAKAVLRRSSSHHPRKETSMTSTLNSLAAQEHIHDLEREARRAHKDEAEPDVSPAAIELRLARADEFQALHRLA